MFVAGRWEVQGIYYRLKSCPVGYVTHDASQGFLNEGCTPCPGYMYNDTITKRLLCQEECPVALVCTNGDWALNPSSLAKGVWKITQDGLQLHLCPKKINGIQVQMLTTKQKEWGSAGDYWPVEHHRQQCLFCEGYRYFDSSAESCTSCGSRQYVNFYKLRKGEYPCRPCNWE
jgi:hypothetical protein